MVSVKTMTINGAEQHILFPALKFLFIFSKTLQIERIKNLNNSH